MELKYILFLCELNKKKLLQKIFPKHLDKIKEKLLQRTHLNGYCKFLKTIWNLFRDSPHPDPA